MSEEIAALRGVRADAAQAACFARMSPQQRLACTFRWTNLTLELARTGIRRSHGDWDDSAVERELIRRFGGSPSRDVSVENGLDDEPFMESPGEIGAILATLETLGVRYALSGSLASSLWGVPRATYDADFLVELRMGDVDRFFRALDGPDWYVDRQSIVEAVQSAGEFNVIHGASGTKIDFWVRAPRAADGIRLLRRRREVILGVPAWVLSPEDTILAKLEWMKAGGGERQFADVVGVLRAQGVAIDREYLTRTAAELGVAEELEKALNAAAG